MDQRALRKLHLRTLFWPGQPPGCLDRRLGAVLFISWSLRSRPIRTCILLVLAAVPVLGIANSRSLSRQQRSALGVALLQLAIAALLIFWWEPFNLKFWLLALLPWMIVVACGAEAVRLRLTPLLPASFSRHAGVVFCGFLVSISVLMLSFNLAFGIIGRSRPSQDYQQAMQAWLDHTGPNDVLITAGDLVPQLQFWENRPNTVNLYSSLLASRNTADPFADLKQRIDAALCRGDAVFLAPAAGDFMTESWLSVLALPRLTFRHFFATYAQEEVFAYHSGVVGADVPVYRIIGAGQCDGQDTSP